jgi:hypothetical protein
LVRFIQKNALGFVALLAAGALSLAAFGSAGVAQATDGPVECDDPSLVVAADDQGGAAGFSIGVAGEIVGVCVQTEDGHSTLVSEDGTALDGCVTVSGIGSSQVLISRSPDCAALTHVDVFFLPVPDEPVIQPETPSDTDDDVEPPADEEDDGETNEDDNGGEDGEEENGAETPVLVVV